MTKSHRDGEYSYFSTKVPHPRERVSVGAYAPVAQGATTVNRLGDEQVQAIDLDELRKRRGAPLTGSEAQPESNGKAAPVLNIPGAESFDPTQLERLANDAFENGGEVYAVAARRQALPRADASVWHDRNTGSAMSVGSAAEETQKMRTTLAELEEAKRRYKEACERENREGQGLTTSEQSPQGEVTPERDKGLNGQFKEGELGRDYSRILMGRPLEAIEGENEMRDPGNSDYLARDDGGIEAALEKPTGSGLRAVFARAQQVLSVTREQGLGAGLRALFGMARDNAVSEVVAAPNVNAEPLNLMEHAGLPEDAELEVEAEGSNTSHGTALPEEIGADELDELAAEVLKGRDPTPTTAVFGDSAAEGPRFGGAAQDEAVLEVIKIYRESQSTPTEP